MRGGHRPDQAVASAEAKYNSVTKMSLQDLRPTFNTDRHFVTTKTCKPNMGIPIVRRHSCSAQSRSRAVEIRGSSLRPMGIVKLRWRISATFDPVAQNHATR